MKIFAIILAGGFGTRIKHLNKDFPKPMILVNGKPFIFWIISLLLRNNINEIAISTHYKSEIIEDYISKTFNKFKIVICRETEPLGTGGAIANCYEKLNIKTDWLLVCNGDSIINFNINILHKRIYHDIYGVIIGKYIKNSNRYGSIEIDKNSNITKFDEKVIKQNSIINCGIYLFKKNIAKSIPPNIKLSLERDVLPKEIELGNKFNVLISKEEFIDIGTEQSLKQADNFMKRNYLKYYDDNKSSI